MCDVVNVETRDAPTFPSFDSIMKLMNCTTVLQHIQKLKYTSVSEIFAFGSILIFFRTKIKLCNFVKTVKIQTTNNLRDKTI